MKGWINELLMKGWFWFIGSFLANDFAHTQVQFVSDSVVSVVLQCLDKTWPIFLRITITHSTMKIESDVNIINKTHTTDIQLQSACQCFQVPHFGTAQLYVIYVMLCLILSATCLICRSLWFAVVTAGIWMEQRSKRLLMTGGQKGTEMNRRSRCEMILSCRWQH